MTFEKLNGVRGNTRLAEAEPKIEEGKSEKRADGIEKRIVGRSSAADDESLVNFVEARIDGGDEPSGKTPGPAPTFAVATEAPVKEEAKNKIFGEVGGLADEMVNDSKLMMGEVWEEPVDDGRENRCRVLRGEVVG